MKCDKKLKSHAEMMPKIRNEAQFDHLNQFKTGMLMLLNSTNQLKSIVELGYKCPRDTWSPAVKLAN